MQDDPNAVPFPAFSTFESGAAPLAPPAEGEEPEVTHGRTRKRRTKTVQPAADKPKRKWTRRAKTMEPLAPSAATTRAENKIAAPVADDPATLSALLLRMINALQALTAPERKRVLATLGEVFR